jgi:hypothetical protein
VIKYGGLKEPQSSSGVIVSTGMGSTGWMKSVIAGATRINASVIGRPYGGKQETENLTEEDDEVIMEDAKILAAPVMAMTAQFEDAEEAASPQMDMLFSEGADMDMAAYAPRLMGFKKSRNLARKKKTFGPSELSKVVGKWSSEELIFAVREPFPSKSTGTNLVFGTISPGEPLRIESLMGETGVIFSDGIENDYIAFNSGTEAAISLADKRGHIVV